ncbi:erythropoietin-like isoform X2 [Sceloporus undulatus]|uniref:erythropoietin-like isoform X2 n=1 Tax=Sceloporus undulatus TaxID=8520 RepID=UPI001C4D85FC|nr:erythropoietin-like isoform X2 [Sceloporus undulatus]
MGIPGLTFFLLMLGFLTPALLLPPRPLCDQSVMDKYIQDASRVEREIEEMCRTSCNLPEPITVLDTKVNFPAWRAMDRSRQASEVWRGQSLLATAIGEVKRQTQPDIRRFLLQLEVIESYLRSIREILRGHNAQVDSQDLNSTPTLSIQTVQKLFNVYSSFLRGKVNLFVSRACQGSGT